MIKQNTALKWIGSCLLMISSQMVMATAPATMPRDTPPPQNMVIEPEPAPSKEGYLIHIIEVMPRFPGCEAIEGTDGDKKQCADQKLLHYIYSNLKYPKEAKEKGIEGMIVVSFVVDKQGRIKDAKAIRDPGGGIGEAAVRIVTAMNDLPEPWTPGIQMGKVVEVRFNLPIRYRLSDIKE